MSIPAISASSGPKHPVPVRFSAQELAAIEQRAEDEQLQGRDGFGNRSAVIQLALAFYLREAPVGWRPENGAILP